MRPTEFSVVSSLAELPAPSKEALAFIEAWKAARHGRLVPRKRDFDPLAVPLLLPDLWIYEYLPAEDAFRCRLAGERVNKAWGVSIAGRMSDEVLGAEANVHVSGVWKRVLGGPLIQFTTLDRPSENDLYMAERTIVPLSDDAGALIFVLGMSRYSLGTLHPVAPPTVPKTAYLIYCDKL